MLHALLQLNHALIEACHIYLKGNIIRPICAQFRLGEAELQRILTNTPSHLAADLHLLLLTRLEDVARSEAHSEHCHPGRHQ